MLSTDRKKALQTTTFKTMRAMRSVLWRGRPEGSKLSRICPPEKAFGACSVKVVQGYLRFFSGRRRAHRRPSLPAGTRDTYNPSFHARRRRMSYSTTVPQAPSPLTRSSSSCSSWSSAAGKGTLFVPTRFLPLMDTVDGGLQGVIVRITHSVIINYPPRNIRSKSLTNLP
jgi:hypothetical protein